LYKNENCHKWKRIVGSTKQQTKTEVIFMYRHIRKGIWNSRDIKNNFVMLWWASMWVSNMHDTHMMVAGKKLNISNGHGKLFFFHFHQQAFSWNFYYFSEKHLGCMRKSSRKGKRFLLVDVVDTVYNLESLLQAFYVNWNLSLV